MTQTDSLKEAAQVRAEANADVASQLLLEAVDAKPARQQELVEQARIHVAAVQSWITPDSPQEAHDALRELTAAIKLFEN